MNHEKYHYEKDLAEYIGNITNDALISFQRAVIDIIDEEIDKFEKLIKECHKSHDATIFIHNNAMLIAKKRTLKEIKSKIKEMY